MSDPSLFGVALLKMGYQSFGTMTVAAIFLAVISSVHVAAGASTSDSVSTSASTSTSARTSASVSTSASTSARTSASTIIETPLPSTVYYVAIDSSGDYVYAVECLGSDNHFYYSHDSGINWAVANIPYQDTTYWDFAISTSGHTIFAVSNELSYWSTDAGLTWSNTSVLSNPYTAFVSPSGTSFVTTSLSHSTTSKSCLSLSVDRGLSWSEINLPLSSYNCVDAAVDDSGQHIVLAVKAVGLYQTLNGGATWQKTLSYDIDRAVLTYAKGSFFVGLAMPYDTVLRSDDNGVTWLVSSGPGNEANGYDSGVSDISVSKNGDTIYAAGSTISVSTDGGSSFDIRFTSLSTAVAVNEADTWGVWSCGSPASQKIYVGNIGE